MNSPTLIGWLQDFWRTLAPASGEAEPSVNKLDEWRTEFHWRGSPLTFDRRRHAVLRDGRVLVKSADIRSIDVRHIRRNDDSPEYWKVSFSTGFFAEVEIGTTRNDVEASIAAARISDVAGVKVRSL